MPRLTGHGRVIRVGETRRRHGPGDWLLAGQAWLLLGVVRVLLLLVPFKRMMGWLGMHPKAPDALTPVHAPADVRADDPQLGRVHWAIDAAVRRAPWEAKCLAQSLTGATMLRVRRMPALVYFGVRPANVAEGRGMTAHSWLVSEGRIVTVPPARGLRRRGRLLPDAVAVATRSGWTRAAVRLLRGDDAGLRTGCARDDASRRGIDHICLPLDRGQDGDVRLHHGSDGIARQSSGRPGRHPAGADRALHGQADGGAGAIWMLGVEDEVAESQLVVRRGHGGEGGSSGEVRAP